MNDYRHISHRTYEALAGCLIFWLNSFNTNVLLKFIFVAQHR